MFLKWLLGLVVLLGLIIGALWVAGQREDAGRHAGEVVIAAPAAAIFPWLIETERRLRWEEGLADVTWESGATAVTAGGRYAQTVTLEEVTTVMAVDVVSVDAPRALVLHMTSDGEMAFDYTVRWTLEDVEGGTRVACVCDGEYLSQPHRLLEPLIALAANAKLASDLERLASLIEGGEG